MKGVESILAKLIRKSIKISIPESDHIVFAWLNHQDNRSMAIRRLIHLEVTQNGYRDVVCDGQVIPHVEDHVEKPEEPSGKVKEKTDGSSFMQSLQDAHAPKKKADVLNDKKKNALNDKKKNALNDEIPTTSSGAIEPIVVDTRPDQTFIEPTVTPTMDLPKTKRAPISVPVYGESDSVDADGFVDPEKLFNGF